VTTELVKTRETNTEVLTTGLVKTPETNTEVLTTELVKIPGTFFLGVREGGKLYYMYFYLIHEQFVPLIG